ncbi:MAG: hypothetical protein K0M67_02325, partial [Thiobacillus sp.]|nr:hypothetical protein [Thiobacillus sp.]
MQAPPASRPVPAAPATKTLPAAEPAHFEEDADGPPWVEEPDDAPLDEGVQTSRRVVEVPVRDPGPAPRLDRLRDPGEAAPMREPVLSAEGDFWFDAIQQLARAETITALVRELGLQSQLVARDADQWLLRVERESLNQGNTRERLSAALKTLGHEIRLVVEIGPVEDSAALRLAAAAARQAHSAPAQAPRPRALRRVNALPPPRHRPQLPKNPPHP